MKTLFLILALLGAAVGHGQSESTDMPTSAGPKAGSAIIRVVASLFEMHGVRPILGRDFVPEDFQGPGAAVISFALWKTSYASRPNVIGEKFKLMDQDFVIVGVMPARPAALEGSLMWVARRKQSTRAGSNRKFR